MAGPVITIALPHPFTPEVAAQVHGLLERLAGCPVEAAKPGNWDFHVAPQRLGITEVDREGERPFAVVVHSPDHESEFDEYFEDGRLTWPDSERLPPLLGFTPVGVISVIAFCNGTVDHVATALLTAAIADITGGTVDAELREHQVELVRGLPGVLYVTPETDDWGAFALGTGAFLRAFAATPNFRLLK